MENDLGRTRGSAEREGNLEAWMGENLVPVGGTVVERKKEKGKGQKSYRRALKRRWLGFDKLDLELPRLELEQVAEKLEEVDESPPAATSQELAVKFNRPALGWMPLEVAEQQLRQEDLLESGEAYSVDGKRRDVLHKLQEEQRDSIAERLTAEGVSEGDTKLVASSLSGLGTDAEVTQSYGERDRGKVGNAFKRTLKELHQARG